MPKTRFIAASSEYNQYIPWSDTILLDENLQDFPRAYMRIKWHENVHAQNHKSPYWFMKDLIHEFREDLFMNFSTGKDAESVRTYLRIHSQNQKVNLSKGMGASIILLLRQIWLFILVPAGILWRRISTWR